MSVAKAEGCAEGQGGLLLVPCDVSWHQAPSPRAVGDAPAAGLAPGRAEPLCDLQGHLPPPPECTHHL